MTKSAETERAETVAWLDAQIDLRAAQEAEQRNQGNHGHADYFGTIQNAYQEVKRALNSGDHHKDKSDAD
jgi:hypothetical protein